MTNKEEEEFIALYKYQKGTGMTHEQVKQLFMFILFQDGDIIEDILDKHNIEYPAL